MNFQAWGVNGSFYLPIKNSVISSSDLRAYVQVILAFLSNNPKPLRAMIGGRREAIKYLFYMEM